MVSLISAATLTLIVGSSARPNLVPDSPARSPERASMQGTRFFSSETVSAALVSRPKGSGDAAVQAGGIPREFYFSRVAYTGYSRGFYGRGRSWATDFPKADQIFLSFIDRLLSNLDAFEREHPVELVDPEIRRFPYPSLPTYVRHGTQKELE